MSEKEAKRHSGEIEGSEKAMFPIKSDIGRKIKKAGQRTYPLAVFRIDF